MLVLKERTTRLVLAARRAGKSAAETVAVMMSVFRRLDPRLHASVTLDNGTTFARHGLLASASGSGTGRPSNSPLLSRPERRGGQTTLTIHATVYCGIPAGLEAFKVAHEVLKAEGALPDQPSKPA